MKRIYAAIALTFATQAAIAQDQVANFLSMAQAAANSPAAKSLVGNVLPAGSGAAVVEGGQIVSGKLPMALVCDFQQPNACVDSDKQASPFHKYIIKQTGETSFTITSIVINTQASGKPSTATIYFTLNQ